MTSADDFFWTYEQAVSYYQFALLNYIGFHDKGMLLAGAAGIPMGRLKSPKRSTWGERTNSGKTYTIDGSYHASHRLLRLLLGGLLLLGGIFHHQLVKGHRTGVADIAGFVELAGLSLSALLAVALVVVEADEVLVVVEMAGLAIFAVFSDSNH